MRFTACAAVMAVAVVVFSMSIVQAQDARAAIEAANQQFSATFAKGDAAALANMYTANGTAFPPNGEPAAGRAAIQKMWQGLMDMGAKDVMLTTTEVEAHGDTAIEVGNAVVRTADGKEMDRGKYIVIWKREGGQWKLHRDIWNSSVPATH